jgi:hypothetical protein
MEYTPDIPMNQPGFFFILGRARSGTTMLRTMFDAHPNVVIPLEAPVIMQLNRKYGKKSRWNHADIDSFLHDLSKVKDFHKWETDMGLLRQRLVNVNGTATFKEIINIVYLTSRSFFPKENITLIGDKNPVYSISAKGLYNIFPEAKYLHLQRDHRAHIFSMLNAKLYASDVVALAYRWRYSARLIGRLKRKHPDSFYTIRYEDLVSDPHFHMERICRFLGIAYTPQMVDYHTRLSTLYPEMEDKIEPHHRKVFEPIDTSRTDAWRKEMDEESVRIADFVVGKRAEQEGYTRIFKNPGWKTRLRVLPAIWYQRLFYLYRYFYTRLPSFLRKRRF